MKFVEAISDKQEIMIVWVQGFGFSNLSGTQGPMFRTSVHLRGTVPRPRAGSFFFPSAKTVFLFTLDLKPTVMCRSVGSETRSWDDM